MKAPPRRAVIQRDSASMDVIAVLLSCEHIYYVRRFSRWSNTKTLACEKCRDDRPKDNWSER